MVKKTVELQLPQWQGGNNPNYQIGAEILETIVPKNSGIERISVPISTDPLSSNKESIDGENILKKQFITTSNILDIKNPDRIITLGGDCSISQSPFNYLNGKYEHFGVIWLDVHPDVSNQSNSHHVHEMVLANLLHAGAPEFNKLVEHPIKPENVMLAGLKYDELRPMDQTVNDLSLSYATPEMLQKNNKAVLKWIKSNHIEHVAIHWDLDVLDPNDFRSIYPAEPHTNIADFPAAVGSLTLKQVIKLLQDIGQSSDLVGLSIAENMPWDAINLRNGLSQLPIFNN